MSYQTGEIKMVSKDCYTENEKITFMKLIYLLKLHLLKVDLHLQNIIP